MEQTKRQRLDSLRSQLENEQNSFLTHWRDLSDFVQPRRARFNLSDKNKGDRKNTKIIDSTATLALRTLRAGMMSGVSSPSRRWFRLTTPDPELAEYGAVKEWLDLVTKRMELVFMRSNLYNALPVVYGDMGLFGTACMYMEEDFKHVVRFYTLPIGSYRIANNDRQQINVLQRDIPLTVRQVVQKFGKYTENGKADWSNISNMVKTLWDRGEYEAWVDISHSLYPNDDWDANKAMSKNKKFASCYYELGSSGGHNTNYMNNEQDKFLSEKGYDLFPALCPRWEVADGDVYGTDCPGMTALGDIKQLQLAEKRAAEAIEKQVRPPMKAPSALRTQKASILPGDITYLDEMDGRGGFQPIHEVKLSIQELEMKSEQIRERISMAFFEPLFLMLANSDRRQITAREIEERHEEKLLAVGPVLEQVNQDLLDPLIDNTFDIMLRQRLIPPAPREIQGMALKVQYESIMAQAQKLVGIGVVERFTSFVSSVATVDPTVLDKIDRDQLVDVYADMTSVPPGIVRSDEDTAAIRGQREQAAAAQQQMEMINQGAQAAKNLSQTDLESDNALARLTNGPAGI
jgi:hypothetical protein